MYSVELYSRVRRACHVDGMSNSAAARLFGIDRKTVAKILKHSVPPAARQGMHSMPERGDIAGKVHQPARSLIRSWLLSIRSLRTI